MKKAVTLEYDEKKDISPRITAKGQAKVAEKIIEVANQNQVPIYEQENLVEDLIDLELGVNIPPKLYELVAQVIAFVEEIDENK